MFRSKSAGREPDRRNVRESGLEAQFAALGRFLEARGYTADGLCVIGANGGFVVDGLKRPDRGAGHTLVQQTSEINADDLASLLTPRR